MEEKYMLSNALTLTKSLINLYINAEVESTNEKTKKIMHNNLDKNLDLQYKLYKKMEENGFYQINNLTKEQIKNTYDKLKMT